MFGITFPRQILTGRICLLDKLTNLVIMWHENIDETKNQKINKRSAPFFLLLSRSEVMNYRYKRKKVSQRHGWAGIIINNNDKCKIVDIENNMVSLPLLCIHNSRIPDFYFLLPYFSFNVP